MKQNLVESQTLRSQAIESGEQIVVGMNRFTEAAESPLTAGQESILTVDASAEREQIERLQAFRKQRNAAEVENALRNLKDVLKNGDNVVPPSVGAAHAGVTTGEWADALRELFGEYRAPTGVSRRVATDVSDETESVRKRVHALSETLGRPIKILVGKPGLDGHSNGAEQVAVRARDVGMEVVYEGIRLTPDQIVQSAADEGVHVIGLSILSGSHGVLVLDVLDRQKRCAADGVPVVVGGIIPEDDAAKLLDAGVKRVYTPKDFDLNRIMGEIVDVVAEANTGA